MSLEELLRGEPAALALAALQHRLLERSRNGLPRPPWADDVHRALYDLAGQPPLLAPVAAGSEVRTGLGIVSGVRAPGIPVREAARTLDLSESYIQRLCRQGSVVASRIGWAWFVDMDSLRNVTRRTAA